ncbi:hypothetical protein [Terricaulis silvestris]|uniref:HEPN domain-containing protein n=1 Tax=Terricaulis silvestris TaxID=2686094 RepID=A0A6I6MS79_9CAUL|nr:hypothetical protein [Terricaulis silvestris]QGZ94003.1 hypothetical protein DSM104635_00819 [Terricaulis silvestris]
MLRPYASAFADLINVLADFRKIDPRPETIESAKRRLTHGNPNSGLPLHALLDAQTAIIPIWIEAGGIPLKSTAAQLHHIEKLQEHGYKESQLFDEVEQLNRRIREDLQGHRFLHVRDDLAPYFDAKYPFGEEVFQSFWSASDDISEASKCLALGRSTACVMHLMRASEVGLKALAKACGVGVQNDWGSYLREIDKALTASMKAAGKKTPDEVFYSESAVKFDRFKVALRNPSMHVDKSYTEERAREIFDATKALMQHLATRISE